MESLECSTKLKANIKKVKLERDELIAKLDEANNLNEKFKNQISSQVDKIRSFEEQLVESKTEVEKLTSTKLVVEPNSKEKYFYVTSFKSVRTYVNLVRNICHLELTYPLTKRTLLVIW